MNIPNEDMQAQMMDDQYKTSYEKLASEVCFLCWDIKEKGAPEVNLQTEVIDRLKELTFHINFLGGAASDKAIDEGYWRAYGTKD